MTTRGWRKFVPSSLRLLGRQVPGLWRYPMQSLPDGEVDYDDYWDSKRGKNMGELSLFQERRAKIVASFITEKSSVLDIGCGDGAVLNHLHEQKNISGIGVDVSKKGLQNVSQLGFETFQCDFNDPKSISQLPEVDYITALEVLEHLPEPEKLLANLSSKCRKSFIISIPNTGYWMHRLRLLMGRCPAQWRLHPGEHLRFWTIRDAHWWVSAMGRNLQEFEAYEGISVLNKICPSWFAMGMVLVVSPSRN